MNRQWFGGCVAVVGAALFLACAGDEDSPSGSGQGAENQACYPNGTCNTGLACEQARCVATRDSAANGGPDATASADATDATPDGAPTNADADAGFQLTSVPGIALWLRADVGVTVTGSKVTKWDDQSGRANHATTAANVTADALFGGKPALHFVGAPINVAHSTTLQPAGADYLVAIVARATAGTGNLYNYELAPPIPAAQDFFTRLGLVDGKVQGQFFGGPPPMTSINGSLNLVAVPSPHLYVLQRLAGMQKLEARIDGTVDATATAASLANSLESANGQYTLKIGEITGDIAEVVLVIGSTGVAQVGAVESYLRGKYSL